MRARAAVATAPGLVAFREVEVPPPGPVDVVVRLTHSWISNGTEGSFVRGERIAGDTPRADSDPLPFPHVPGYQKVGIVEKVGAEVRDLHVGQRVFATVSRVEGQFYGHGGHVSPAVTHHSQVFALPDGLDPVAASGLVLTQVGFNCGMRPPVAPGDTAIVLGDGMVGHWSAQTLARRGARVLLVGRHDDRLRRFTLGETLNARLRDPVDAARAFAPDGVATLVDTVGDLPAVMALLPALRHNSHIVSAGFYGHDGKIDIQRLRDREITLHCPAGWTRGRLEETLAWIADGRLETLPLITHRFPAERAGDAFALILGRTEPVLGVVLDW